MSPLTLPRVRLTAVLTHPTQYFAPWFRQIERDVPGLELTVLHATVPDAAQQGVGFAQPVSFGDDLLAGYRHLIVRPPGPGADVSSDAFRGVDVPEIGRAIAESDPDVVLLMGWHSITQLRALLWCRRHAIPVLYRGDTHLGLAPAGWRRITWGLRTRVLLRQFAGALAVGRSARRYLLRFGVDPTRIFHSPHAIDLARFARLAAPHATPEERAAARVALGLDPSRPVLLFAGKLTAIKRPLDLVAATALLADGTQLLVAGDGPLRVPLETAARQAGVSLTITGALAQDEMPRAYAAADALVLPSERESWGLVINEALACGTPVIASTGCGAADDLVHPGRSGERFAPGNVPQLADAIRRWRARAGDRDAIARACRDTVAPNDFAAASIGLVSACHAVATGRWRERASRVIPPLRVIAPCGNMAIQGGLERMTFAVLGTARLAGAHVHAVHNSWAEPADAQRRHPIAALADQVGASRSTGLYWYHLTRHTRSPWDFVLMAQDVIRTSLGFLRDAWALSPTHVLLPERTALVRNLPALYLLRLVGVRVILRIGNAPAPGAFNRRFWRWVVAPAVDEMIGNSEYVVREVLAHGVPATKLRCVPNHFYRSDRPDHITPRDPMRIVFVGQLIAEKGVDLLVDAVGLLVVRGMPVSLDIVGDLGAWEAPGSEGFKAQLRARAESPVLAGRVRFLGQRGDVMRLLASATVHCAPSRPAMLEGMPGVVIEAKHAGRPTVAFDLGPFPEMIDHGRDGFLCRDESPESLAEGLAYCLDAARWEGLTAATLASARVYSRERFERSILAALGVETTTLPAAGAVDAVRERAS